MSTEHLPIRRARARMGCGWRRPVLAALFAVVAPVVQAQGPVGRLASPVPGVAASGLGYHDPRSAFKPLQERDGFVSWNLLGGVTTRTEKQRVVAQFPKAVQELDRKTVRVQGFMMPLEPGDRQRHFLLSAVPTSCSFCLPAGPEGLIEVRSRTPVRYTLEAVQLEGRLAVLNDDPYGLFYRLVDAAPWASGTP